ncbi:c-type cytochrome biogenesis protein CcmI [Rhizobium sp. TRM95111]|uniref:c-type cytochrome biogenesis protein CcmI n=1 Tax=Rhizobium alarense TaxID=2846851 RepID=UPI001F2A319C|nr:c-type cytochrome biogenesis protein CcmI [Rhizobium alarense]MCF3642588.1 c-type cytochrome biogenesis protein CcmI [Rhizobium alarense]
MIFWILIAVLTAVVTVVLLLPLLRSGRLAVPTESHDVEVYRDQLDEVARDAKAGLIGADEAELARAEIARRLIAAKAKEERAAPAARRRNRLAQSAVVLAIPAIGLCLYMPGGRPDLPAQPLAARLANPGNDINILIAKAEQHLAENPNDAAGWELLAPIYFRSGRMEDAANAFREALRLSGPSPERHDGYAETLIAMAGGVVTEEAREQLRRSLALDADNPRARFYLALSLEQEGKRDEAKAAFETLARQSPEGAPWLPLVDRHIAGLSKAAPSTTLGTPTADDVAAAEQLDAEGRRQMIAGMVASLEDKLKENPDNFEGWMRIIRSHVVLDQRDKAAAALGTALKTFPPESENGRQLLALAAELAIPTGGKAQ